jgi:hypothetical protein
LQDFKLLAHPETGNNWWVPPSLVLKTPPVSTEEGTEGIQEAEDVDAGADLEVITLPLSTDNQEVLEDAVPALSESVDEESPAADHSQGHMISRSPKKEIIRGPSAYILARQNALRSIMLPGTTYYRRNQRLFGGSGSRFPALAKSAVWRQDMDAFILDHMRQQIIQLILYLSTLCIKEKRHYITQCFGWDDVKFKHRGAVLWFDDLATNEGDSQDKPGSFAIFDLDIENDTAKTGVPVHNMAMLLGDKYAEQVRRGAAVFKDGSIFMLAGRRTTDLQLKLWKLQGYLSDYKDV